MSDRFVNDIKKRNIAICLSGINTEYQGKICRAIAEKADALSYKVALFSPFSNNSSGTAFDDGEANIYNLIDYPSYDLIIILPQCMTNPNITKTIIEKSESFGVPVMTIGNDLTPATYQIDFESQSFVYELTEHLITEHSCKRFCFMGGIEGCDADVHRFGDFKRCLDDKGIEFDERNHLYGGFINSQAEVSISEYLKDNELPDAIVCCNDSMAVGVATVLLDMGFRIPEDVIVTGYDGIEEVFVFNPTITTVKEPVIEAGDLAIEMIEKIFNGEEVPPIITMKNQIIYGQSCGCGEGSKVDANALHGRLYSELYGLNYYTKRYIRMNEDLTNSHNLDDYFKNLNAYSDDINCNHLYICINEDVFKVDTDPNNLDINDDYLVSGYPEKMVIKLAHSWNSDICGTKMKTMDIIQFILNHDESNTYMVTPIHYKDRTFGFCMISYLDNKSNYYLYNMWLTNISTSLENVRIKVNLRSYADKLKEIYLTDTLTSLYNRYGYYMHAQKIFDKCKAEKKSCMFFCADLDRLKPINDNFGHMYGDKAILAVADALRYAGDKSVISARVGGDEFEAIAYNYTLSETSTFCQRFKEYLDDYNATGVNKFTVDASFGVYVVEPDENMHFEDGSKIADARMYANKKAKRGIY